MLLPEFTFLADGRAPEVGAIQPDAVDPMATEAAAMEVIASHPEIQASKSMLVCWEWLVPLLPSGLGLFT